MVFKVEEGGLEKRAAPVYTALSRLFVTSGQAPYFRTSVPRSEVPIGTEQPTTRASAQIFDAPDTRTLVAATNVYPLLIEGDEVGKLRTDLYGPAPPESEVTAKAIFSGATAARYQSSEIPVIELFATANTAPAAIKLATDTSKTFQSYIARKQQNAKIPPRQRIVIESLETPTEATAVGGTSIGLPILALLAILTAFGALAIMVDRMFPRRKRADANVAESPAVSHEERSRERHVGISETG